jgi:hypothetical protein
MDETKRMNGERIDNDGQTLQPKKSYEEPRLVRVSLRPDEAVLGHCKISASAGPAGGSCAALGGCFVPGS